MPRGFPGQLTCLEQVVALGAGRLPEALVAGAGDVLARARQRLASGDHLVVAGLLGGTGSGKSSLFNVLVGRGLAPVGAVRPVTGDSRAAAIGEAAAAERLLDWLGIDHRHHLAPGPGLPQGLILVDLPDHDSIALEHAVLADRFAERLDLLLWVVDPIKYAHGALYDRYLRRLSMHAAVTVVVLNRIDELSDGDRAACREDLRRRLDAEHLAGAELVSTSATTGEGVEDLRTRLIHETERRRAAAERISADVRGIAARAAAQLAEAPLLDAVPIDALTGAVAAALDVRGAVVEAGQAYTEAALATSRSGVGAAVATAFRPVRRLMRRTVHWLPARTARPPAAGSAGPSGPGRPGGHTDGAYPARVRRAMLDLGDAVGTSTTDAGKRLRGTVTASAEPLIEQAATAVRAAIAPPTRRRWWRLLPVLPTAAEIVAVGALLWLAALRVPLLALPEPATVPSPVGDVPVPTVVLAAGLLARVVAGLLRRSVISLAASRYSDATSRSLRAAVESAVEDQVVVPLEEELEAMRALADAIACAAGRRHSQ